MIVISFYLKLKITITTQLIEFSFLGKHNIGNRMVLCYSILYLSLGVVLGYMFYPFNTETLDSNQFFIKCKKYREKNKREESRYLED